MLDRGHMVRHRRLERPMKRGRAWWSRSGALWIAEYGDPTDRWDVHRLHERYAAELPWW